MLIKNTFQLLKPLRLFLANIRVRRARLYGLGMGKSGTHSLADIFIGPVRTGHEPEALPLIDRILAFEAGTIDERDFNKWLRARDRRLAFDVDSSNLNYHILDFLLSEFSDSRFVLTIRDCYSWCDSMINHSVRFAKTTDQRWQRLRDSRFKSNVFHHAPEERLLKESGLYTLDGYFSYWTEHNERVIQKVPSERLLVIRTDQIQQRALEIAKFAGLPMQTISIEGSHGFKNPEKQAFLKQIDREFIESKVKKHCAPLMAQFFPEIRTLDDSPLQK